jgi:hypothetical protein
MISRHPGARRFRRSARGYSDGMRAMFVIYVLVIVAGIVAYTIVGITHS